MRLRRQETAVQVQAGLAPRRSRRLIARKCPIAAPERVAAGWGKKPLCLVHVLTV
jgi:hypothetical protein